MGLAYCKSLCSSKKKSEYTLNNDAARPKPATAQDFQVSTIQTAVTSASQESQQTTMTATIAKMTSDLDDDDDDDDFGEMRPVRAKAKKASPQPPQESFIEKDVCKESELKDNEMREVDMGDDKKVLLIKQNGKFSAIGAKCAHYGLPLVGGALSDGRIRCPWHGACFNIETGDIEEFPGLDSLPCFQVNVEKGVVRVRAKKSDLDKDVRVKPATLTNDKTNGQTFVIIGGGPSSLTCAETLRQNGFGGRIVMVCKEAFLPYDRVKISKFMNLKHEDVRLRTQTFYDEKRIEVTLGVQATALDTNAKQVSLSKGGKLKYDKLFIATGSRAKKSSITGSDLKNIFALRNIDDAHAIDAKLTASSHVVVVGSSFIALEAASYCVDKVAKVTVVGRSAVPLIDSFGEAVGNRIMQLCKSKNVEFIMNSGIKSFFAIDQEEAVSAVKLLNDEIVKANVCIIGIGSQLNTDFLQKSGLSINDDGSIDTDLFMETNVADVFVGGDIANSPILTNNNQPATIGHYALAQHHGKVAALNMLGVMTTLKAVPYFFIYIFGTCFTYTGHGKASEVIIDGDLDGLKYSAFYIDAKQNVIAMSSCQPDRRIAEFAEKLAQGHRFIKQDLSTLFGIKLEASKAVSEAPPPTPAIVTSAFVQPEDDFIEKVAGVESDFDENSMKEIDMGDDKKVLLIKQNGKFTAVGAKCGHYGAPLIAGALSDGRIRCPWHGACYSTETGDIEEFPGLDAIPCFQVKVQRGVVRIRAKKSDLESDKRVKAVTLNGSRSGEIFVVIGGGPSAQTCVETLRQNGFRGRILMICKEAFLPYDRVKVSKFLNTKVEDIQLRNRSYYDENQIEVSLNVEATSLDAKLKEVSLSSGNKLKYDKIFIATGSRPIKPFHPGSDFNNIFTLRNLDDAHAIDARLKPASHVVIVGSSFVAMEAATYCADKVAKVTVVGRSTVPLIEVFGEAIGNRIMQLGKSKNVVFINSSGVKRFHGNHKNLESVELLSGETLWADVCIVGIGSELNTDFLSGSGLSINNNGSVDTDLFMATSIADVYIGGDIANSPILTNKNQPATIGHYALAQYHGKVAALNMLGVKTELKSVPYFFTYLFGHWFTYTGHGKGSEIFIEGDLESLKFVAFYFDEKENVIAMSSCQPDRSIAEFAEKLAQGYQFHKDDIEWVNEHEE